MCVENFDWVGPYFYRDAPYYEELWHSLFRENTTYISELNCVPSEGISNTSALLTAVVHATSHSKYIYPSANRAVLALCSHTRSCNKCLQIVYYTMSNRHHSRHKTCSIRESSHTFLIHFTSTSGYRAEFRTVSDVTVVSYITKTSRTCL